MSNIEVTKELISQILQNTQSTDNEVRQKAEKILNEIKYQSSLYVNLLDIVFSTSDQRIQMQALLIIKSILRQEISKRKNAIDFNTVQNNKNLSDIANVILFVKQKIISYLYDANFENKIIFTQIKDIILIITDKYYPSEWEELHKFFKSFYTLPFCADNFGNPKFWFVSSSITSIMYSVIKQFSKKKSPISKSKFYSYKQMYLDFYVIYYQNLLSLFENNLQKFTSIELTVECLKTLKICDMVLIKLIEISYNQSEFHKDVQILSMVKIVMNRIKSILELINKIQDKTIKEVLLHNLFKMIKNCSSLQSSTPIIFYKDLKTYIEILFAIIATCEKLDSDNINSALYALAKVISGYAYQNNYEKSARKIKETKDDDFLNKTPEKKSINKIGDISNVLLFVSPTKYRNFGKELEIANELYSECFTESTINGLLNRLINSIPFIFKKENENLEIQILSELEDDYMSKYDNFSTNTFSFQTLYKNILETIITNFTSISLKYIKDNLNKFYAASISEINFLVCDSFFYFVNILPTLYKSGVISINDMIEPSKYIAYIETLISKSDLILKKYIVTLSKWSSILISNETVFDYINNLIVIIKNTKNDYVLIQSCLCVKTIIDAIDKQLETNDNIKTMVNKEVFSCLMKSKVNWGELLSLVANIFMKVIPIIESSELIISLIKLFTRLIEISHSQNNDVLTVIKNAKLLEIILNTKDEFIEGFYIKMFHSLLATIQNADVVSIAFAFGEKLLSKNVNVNNLSFILFIVRIANDVPGVREVILNFLKKTSKLFLSNTPILSTQNLIISIIEEIVLFDILDTNDITSIIDMMVNKYISTYETYVKCTMNMKDEISTQMKKNLDITIGDLCEGKVILLNAMSTLILFYKDKKNIDITSHFRNVLPSTIKEVQIAATTPEQIAPSSSYISALLLFVERFALMNFNIFNEAIMLICNEVQTTPEEIMREILLVMIQGLTIEVRKMNVLFVSVIMSKISYEFFVRNADNVFAICGSLIYVEYIKKAEGVRKINENDIISKPSKLTMSKRKEELIKNDQMMKFDIYNLFTEGVRRLCSSNGKSIETFLCEGNVNSEKNREIFGLKY